MVSGFFEYCYIVSSFRLPRQYNLNISHLYLIIFHPKKKFENADTETYQTEDEGNKTFETINRNIYFKMKIQFLLD